MMSTPSLRLCTVLTVLRAFPCRSRLGDADMAATMEEEVRGCGGSGRCREGSCGHSCPGYPVPVASSANTSLRKSMCERPPRGCDPVRGPASSAQVARPLYPEPRFPGRAWHVVRAQRILAAILNSGVIVVLCMCLALCNAHHTHLLAPAVTHGDRRIGADSARMSLGPPLSCSLRQHLPLLAEGIQKCLLPPKCTHTSSCLFNCLPAASQELAMRPA